MKNRINLYQIEFQPKPDWLSLSSIIGMLSIMIILLSLISGLLSYKAKQAEEAYFNASATYDDLTNNVDTLKNQIINTTQDPALEAKVKKLETEIKNQRLVLSEIANRDPLKQQGFATLFDELAINAPNDLWLNRIAISDNEIIFEGEVTSPAAMPKWLQKLSQSSSFSGKNFGSVRVYEQDSSLHFTLSTQRIQQAAGGRQQ